MLDDYLKVRGVGDVLAAGSALVLVTMIVHYWGYAIFAGIDVLAFFAIQDYLRLAALWVPVVLSIYVTASVVAISIGYFNTNYPGLGSVTIILVFVLIYGAIAYLSIKYSLNTDPYLTEPGGKIAATALIVILLVIIVLSVYMKNKEYISSSQSVLIVMILITILEFVFSQYIAMMSFDTIFIAVGVSLAVLLYMYEHKIITLTRLRYDDGIVGAVVVATIVFTFGIGAHQSQGRLYSETPSVAVHVNYNDEPIEGTILINLSNTLLLSEPDSRDYIAISQREIRSIQRLDD